MTALAPIYFRRTYDEALALTVEARDYVAWKEVRERQGQGVVTRLTMSCETMRITSRLTQVMAWLLFQRAVFEGELAQEEVRAEARLGAHEICLDDRALADESLPLGLRSLMERSHRLYLRIARLDEQAVRAER
jgi:regulator of CtrA degradation